MKKKKTTITDIANALSLTPSAVSKALSDHPRISDATKEAVREMAEKLNYQRNKIASALRKGQSMLVGVIIPAANINFFSSVVKGIEDTLNAAGYQVIISQSYDDPEKERINVQTLLTSQVDAIFASIANKTVDFEHFAKVRESGIPLILFDRVEESLGGSTVVIDDHQGAYQAVEHLIEQGCRRIAHLAGYHNVSLYQSRIEGYRNALQDAGLPINQEWIMESGLSLDDGRRCMEELLRHPQPPDGIFAAGDHAAAGAMQVLQERQIKIPEEVAVVGFSNEPFSSMIKPALSTVDQHSETMGRLAAQAFLQQLNAAEAFSLPPQKKILSPDLLIRASSLRKVTNQTHNRH